MLTREKAIEQAELDLASIYIDGLQNIIQKLPASLDQPDDGCMQQCLDHESLHYKAIPKVRSRGSSRRRMGATCIELWQTSYCYLNPSIKSFCEPT